VSPLFEIDRQDDRERSSDGISRYGAYLAQRYDSALDHDEIDDPHRWAAWCWHVATPPVMAPGFVRQLDPIIRTIVYRDDWQGDLAARIEVATPWPARLPGRWQAWQQSATGRIEAPELRAGAPVALATVTLEVILEGLELPVVEFRDRRTLVDVAARTATAVANAIELHAGDAVRALWQR
jgi:hypothetical protein